MTLTFEKIGLKAEEESVYATVLAFSQLTMGEISNYTKIDLPVLEGVINNLIQKKFLVKIDSLDRYVAKFPFMEASNDLKIALDKVKALSTDLSNFFTEQKTKLKQEEDAKKAQLSKDLEEGMTQIKTLADNITKQINELMKNNKDLLSQKSTSNKDVIEKVLTEKAQSIDTDLTTQQSQGDEQLLALISDFAKKATTLQQNLTTTVNSYNENQIALNTQALQKITSDIDNFSNTIKQIFTTNTTETTTTHQEIAKKFIDDINQIVSSYETIISETNNQLTTIITSTRDKMAENINTTNVNLNNAMTSQFKDISSQLTDLTTNISTTQENYSLNQSKQEKLVVNTWTDTTSQNLEELRTQISDINTKLTKDYNDHINNFKTNISTSIQKFNTGTKPAIQKMKENVEIGLKNSQAQVQTVVNKFNETVTSLFNELSTKIIEVSNATKDQSKILQDSLQTNFDTTGATWNTFLATISDTLAQMISQLESAREEHGNNATQSITNTISNWTNQQNNNISNLRSESVKLKQQLDKDLENMFNTTKTTITTQKEQTDKSILDLLKTMQQGILELEEQSTNSLHEENTAMSTNFQEKLKLLQDTLQENIKKFKIDKTTAITTSFDGLITKSNNFLKENLTKVDTTVAETKKNSDSDLRVVSSLQTKNTTESLQQLITTLDSTSKSQQQVLDNYKKNYDQLYQSIKQQVVIVKNNLQELSFKQIDANLNDLLLSIDKWSTITEELTKTSNESANQVDILGKSLLTYVSDQYKLIDTNVTNVSGKLFEAIQLSEGTLSNQSNLLVDIDKQVSTYKYPIVNSAPIYGWNSVLKLIDQMFDRITSGMTLFIYNSNCIPVEKILATKKTQRITLISKLDTTVDKSLIKKLLEKDNVQIRALEPTPPSPTGTTMPPYLVVDKDGEEVVFGAAEKGKEFVGLHSRNQEFVHIVGTDITGSYMGRSKKLNKSDFV